MAEKPIQPITYSLPTNWTKGQIVSPGGADVGYVENYGYNYLMQAVNAVIAGLNAVNDAFPELSAGAVQAVTIASTAWQLDSSGGPGGTQDYSYYADVVLSSAAATQFPVAAVQKTSLDVSSAAGLCPSMKAQAGSLRFWAQQPASDGISLTVALIDGGTDSPGGGWGIVNAGGSARVNVPGGVAGLDDNGKISTDQLPSLGFVEMLENIPAGQRLPNTLYSLTEADYGSAGA